jgi:outer membrane protein assembly factor BamA
MFERFSLGNTGALRGYNKFDFAPLGGDRVVYGSLDYRYRKITVFYDVGSVWDAGEEITVRPSVGLGVGNSEKQDFFLGVAVPLIESGMTPTFMVVGRFSAF